MNLCITLHFCNSGCFVNDLFSKIEAMIKDSSEGSISGRVIISHEDESCLPKDKKRSFIYPEASSFFSAQPYPLDPPKIQLLVSGSTLFFNAKVTELLSKPSINIVYLSIAFDMDGVYNEKVIKGSGIKAETVVQACADSVAASYIDDKMPCSGLL